MGFPARRRDRPSEPVSPRAVWHDRTPHEHPQRYYGTGVAPHAASERFVFTVPQGRMALLHNCFLYARRMTAPTTLGLVGLYLQVGNTTYWMLQHYDNTVHSRVNLVFSPELLLLADSNVRALTDDLSTGGTMEYLISALITEFDA